MPGPRVTGGPSGARLAGAAGPAPRPPRARSAVAPPASQRGLALCGLALGAAMGAGHVPLAAWWLALPALAAAVALSLPLAAGRAALLGLAFGVGHFVVALHWIVEPFLVDVARHGWLAPFALVGLSAFMASYWGVAFGLAARLARGPAARAALIAVALALAEMARARAFTGFAWASPAYLWSETPLYQALAWVGPHGLTLLTALAAGGLALALARPAMVLPPLVGLAALALLGAAREVPPPAADAPVIRLVQPNAAQRLKWDPAWREVFLRRGLDATAAPAGHLGAPSLVVWPEASISHALYAEAPYPPSDARPVIEAVARAAGGAPAVLGLNRVEGGRLTNGLVVTGRGGGIAETYDKHHLVPFGEFMPLGELAARAGLRGLAASDGAGYAAGPGPRVIDVPGIGPALPLICYEAVFPRDARAPTRPRLILHITNDAWFGTFAGPFQHLAQARARAIEQGLPVMRAANTGVSAAIDARGRVRASLPLGVAGHIDARLPAALPPTPYARTGDAPLALGLALVLGAAGLRRLRR